MLDMHDVVTQLNMTDKRLSKSQRLIAQYLIQHYDRAVYMTAGALGEHVGVSESTVVRFATAMGYPGYPQFQRALQELISHRLTASERMGLSTDVKPDSALSAVLKSDVRNLQNTLDSLPQRVFDDAVSRLLSARRIYVMGLRSAAPLAQFMGYYLNYIFDDVRLVSSGATDVFESIARIDKEDVLLGISFPRYSTRTLEAMRFAKRRGAQVIALTDGPMSPMGEIADTCLTARTDMSSFVDSLTAPLSVINALLFSLGLHRKDEMNHHLDQLEGIWNAQSVYVEDADHE